MIEPTGYTALDLIGFTDKGGYDPTANYVKNDIVTVGNTKWRCKIDDTTGVTPAENANWTIYLESATSLAGMDDTDITSPKNGDGLVHDGNDWKNIPIMTKEQWKKNGAYNILENKGKSQVTDGITYVVNADGTFTTNGTSNPSSGLNAYFYIVPDNSASWLRLKAGSKYKFNCCPKGGSTSTYYVQFLYRTEVGGTSLNFGNDTGNGILIEPTADVICYIRLVISKTVQMSSNTVFKPMLTTDPNATYDDYVPHAKTNRELTEDVTPQVNGVYTKIGKLVVFSVSSWNDSATAISNGIPEGYRPKNTTISVVEQRLTASIGTPEMKRITFNTNGTIVLSDSNTVFIGTCSWVTA